MYPISVYLHIPFCLKRCHYCDFCSTSGRQDAIAQYVHALCLEIEQWVALSAVKLPVHTVYFGGGTPTLLSVKQFEAILSVIFERFDCSSEMEITVEANPGTLSLDYLRDLRKLGINRISLGMQSAHDPELRLLGRIHRYEDVVQAVRWSRLAGFGHLNLDLIYGLPEQKMEAWKHTLEVAVSLSPEHLSLYALSLECGTSLYDWTMRGLVAIPDEDVVAGMYEFAMDYLDTKRYLQYEISNWARATDGYMCQHNLQYWRNFPYVGFGAGAHGFVFGYRLENVSDADEYMRRMDKAVQAELPCSPATDVLQRVDRQMEMEETMMLGLRLTQEGVSQRAFYERFGQTPVMKFGKQLRYLVEVGLLEYAGKNNDCIRLTRRGRLLGNQAFMHFIDTERRIT
ncbi:MAG: radical SAM family heme chaperone HemW [Anaerolineae bacterium]|nr:radical SAM family heme chaperone HemW [Anaerolineae bacterium]